MTDVNLINVNKREIKTSLLKYVLSSVAAMWVFTIYTMVDGMFVAKGVGLDALAAVNISMPFVNLSFGLSILFGIGASTRASVYKGQGKYKDADKVFTESILTVLVLSVIVSVVALFNLERLAYLLGATDVTIEYVKDYLGILLLFEICYMTGYALEVMVKADGYPHKAIFIPLIGAVCNIGLDYVFIFHFDWGIAGAAWATGASQLVSFLLFAHHFFSKKSGFKFIRIKWNLRDALHTAKLGVSDCVTELSMAAVIFLFNNVLLRISGEDGVAIYTVISYVSQLILMTMVGLNQGMQPLVSYYFGKGEYATQRYILRLSMKTAVFFSVLAFAIGVTYPDPVVSMFIDPAEDGELFLHGVAAFKMFSFSFLPLGVVVVISGYFTALEIAKNAMVISVARGLVFVTLSLFVMTFLLGETGVWLSMAVSETMSLILAITLYGKYRKREQIEIKPGRVILNERS